MPTSTASLSPSLDSSRLEALLESAQLLHSSLNLEDLLRHLLRSVMGRLLVSKAVIAIAPAGSDGSMRLELVRGVPSLKVGNEFSTTEALQHGILEMWRGVCVHKTFERNNGKSVALFGLNRKGIRHCT